MTTKSFKESDVEHRWFVVDADGLVLGRMCAAIARILQGKHKPCYTPHADTGDYVIVVNARKVKVTGRKEELKLYRHHSGYIGGLKEIPFKRMMEKKPEEIIKHAVRGMMPKTKLGRRMMKKLKVYADGSHLHAAQRPEPLELNL